MGYWKKIVLTAFVCILWSADSAAGPAAFYKIIPHASGPTCADALNNLVGTQLYSGATAEGTPSFTGVAANYAVASQSEAAQLCQSIGKVAVPIATQGSSDALNYAMGAHPWIKSDAGTVSDADARCSITFTGNGTDDGTPGTASAFNTYLELNGVCLDQADLDSPPADPTITAAQ